MVGVHESYHHVFLKHLFWLIYFCTTYISTWWNGHIKFKVVHICSYSLTTFYIVSSASIVYILWGKVRWVLIKACPSRWIWSSWIAQHISRRHGLTHMFSACPRFTHRAGRSAGRKFESAVTMHPSMHILYIFVSFTLDDCMTWSYHMIHMINHAV